MGSDCVLDSRCTTWSITCKMPKVNLDHRPAEVNACRETHIALSLDWAWLSAPVGDDRGSSDA